MWVWKNSRQTYYCRECGATVKWNKKTRVGWCECKILELDEGGSVPPLTVHGKFKPRGEKK